MIDLDLKNRKIMYELDVNSRQSFHEIAKKAGLSKDSVIYRIEKLREKGIIKRFHTVIDVGKLGFISFRLYLKLRNVNPKKEKDIIDFLKKQEEITWLVSIDGDYDIGCWILSKNIKGANDVWKRILKKYGNFIDRRNLTIFTRVSYFPRVYILDRKKNVDEYVFITEPSVVKLDKMDLQILKMIAGNARIPVIEIAEKLNITPKTVSARIKQLEKNKVIIGYRTMFDLEKINEQYFKLFIRTQNITEEKEIKFREFIIQHPRIIYDNEVLGGEDFEIEVQVESLKQLREFVNELKEKFSDIIKEYKTLMFYKEHKYVFFPL